MLNNEVSVLSEGAGIMLSDEQVASIETACEALKGVTDACDISYAKPEFVDFLLKCDPATILALCATVKALLAEVGRLQKPRMFPIQDGAPAVRWELAEKAYTTYASLYGTSQSLIRLAERGGFGLEEFSCLYLGHDPRCRHSEKCVAEVESQIGYVADLQSQIASLQKENTRLLDNASCEMCDKSLYDTSGNQIDPPVCLQCHNALQAQLAALREENEKLKASRRVHELDNHHNALACGYCAIPKSKAQITGDGLR